MIPSDCSAGSSVHLHWCWLLDFHGKWWWVLLLGMRGEQLGGWMSDCNPWSYEKPWTSCYNTQQPLLFLSTCFLQPNIHFLIGLLTFRTHNLIHFSHIFIRRKAVEFPFTCIFLYICVIYILLDYYLQIDEVYIHSSAEINGKSILQCSFFHWKPLSSITWPLTEHKTVSLNGLNLSLTSWEVILASILMTSFGSDISESWQYRFYVMILWVNYSVTWLV